MSIRETSGYESGSEIRNWIGLQFFAEGGDGGADTVSYTHLSTYPRP